MYLLFTKPILILWIFFRFPYEQSLEISRIHSDKVLEILKSEVKEYKSVISEISLSEVGFLLALYFL
ncbi:hypothetical protein [Borrelia miyamotoi]|uniref:hypothetical protein n=1 Tax=Borrelia miyamotoi TaxID=47466 RepID=UPI001F073914|nr:hypothetical protein [Borrelia miyamotoi]